MLTELVVRDLGVIADAAVVVGPGMTALTGETGAGKTLLVAALELLVGGRADPGVVRAGAPEARVDGRFVDAGGTEVVLSRVVPPEGRSRAYVDGRPVPAGTLAELGAALLDLHGQHAHQSLLAGPAQREALDAHGGVALGPWIEATARLRAAEAELAVFGGDDRARARELDLVRFQVGELDAAGLDDPDEESHLAVRAALLADAGTAREAGAAAYGHLFDEGGAADLVGEASAVLHGRAAFAEPEARLRSVGAELADIAADVRSIAESVVDDPDELESVGRRRALLGDLRRKYGDTLAEVIAYREQTRTRLAELEAHDVHAAEADARRRCAMGDVETTAAAVRRSRQDAAPALVAAVERRLHGLAMPHARVEVEVAETGAGDDVRILLAANRGEPARPLAKVASGGELARVMLALRLALVERGGGLDGRTLVFDEVDAGVGGEAARAVGASLADLARSAQVLVVTHLPQVAAFADRQVVVTKAETAERTIATAVAVEGEDRLVELSRMLSGDAASRTARGHARELLASARREDAR